MCPDCALSGEKILSKSTSEKLPKSASALTVAPHLQSPAPKQLGLYFFFPGQQLVDTCDPPQPWAGALPSVAGVGTQATYDFESVVQLMYLACHCQQACTHDTETQC